MSECLATRSLAVPRFLQTRRAMSLQATDIRILQLAFGSHVDLRALRARNPEVIIAFANVNADLLRRKHFKDGEKIEDQSNTRGKCLQQVDKGQFSALCNLISHVLLLARDRIWVLDNLMDGLVFLCFETLHDLFKNSHQLEDSHILKLSLNVRDFCQRL